MSGLCERKDWQGASSGTDVVPERSGGVNLGFSRFNPIITFLKYVYDRIRLSESKTPHTKDYHYAYGKKGGRRTRPSGRAHVPKQSVARSSA